MTDTKKSESKKQKSVDEARRERLVKALRTNLLKRKMQKTLRAETETPSK